MPTIPRFVLKLCYPVILLFMMNYQGVAKNITSLSSGKILSRSSVMQHEATEKVKHHNFQTELEFQLLNSTHFTQFYGVDAIFSYHKTSPVILGIGTELSYCDFHNDNGWNLYHLYFLPVFFDNKFCLLKNSKLVPSIHLSEGISFVNYNKKILYTDIPTYHVSETGLYVFWGFDFKIKTKGRFTPSAGVGFKGYHMSLNNLDVNPHGITFRAGVTF